MMRNRPALLTHRFATVAVCEKGALSFLVSCCISTHCAPSKTYTHEALFYGVTIMCRREITVNLRTKVVHTKQQQPSLLLFSLSVSARNNKMSSCCITSFPTHQPAAGLKRILRGALASEFHEFLKKHDNNKNKQRSRSPRAKKKHITQKHCSGGCLNGWMDAQGQR